MEVNPEKENQIPEQLAKHVNEAWAAVPPNTLDQSKWMSQDECHNALSAWIDKMLENGKLKGLSDDTMSEIAKCRTYTTSGDIANAHSEYEKAYDLYNGISPNNPPEPSPKPQPGPGPGPGPSQAVTYSSEGANINLHDILTNGDIWEDADSKATPPVKADTIIDSGKVDAYFKELFKDISKHKNIKNISIGKMNFANLDALNDLLDKGKTSLPIAPGGDISSAVETLAGKDKSNTNLFFQALDNNSKNQKLSATMFDPNNNWTPPKNTGIDDIKDNIYQKMGIGCINWQLPSKTLPNADYIKNVLRSTNGSVENNLDATDINDPSQLPDPDFKKNFSKYFNGVNLSGDISNPTKIADSLSKWYGCVNKDLSKINLSIDLDADLSPGKTNDVRQATEAGKKDAKMMKQVLIELAKKLNIKKINAGDFGSLNFKESGHSSDLLYTTTGEVYNAFWNAFFDQFDTSTGGT